jgi:hypothetical protein
MPNIPEKIFNQAALLLVAALQRNQTFSICITKRESGKRAYLLCLVEINGGEHDKQTILPLAELITDQVYRHPKDHIGYVPVATHKERRPRRKQPVPA